MLLQILSGRIALVSKKPNKGGFKMNKTELIEAIAKETGLSKKDSEKAVKAFVDVVSDALKKKDKVQTCGCRRNA